MLKGSTVKLILILLIIILLIGYFNIKEKIYNQNLINLISQIKNEIKSENWDEAIEYSNKIEKEWIRIKYLLMINFGEAEISTLEEHINLLKSGTINKDKVSALSSTLYLEDTWDNVNKFVPQP